MLKFISAALAALFFIGATDATANGAVINQKIDGVVDDSLFPLADQLLSASADGKLKKVRLFINSPGGDVLAGSIYISAMEIAKARGAKFECYVPMLAASMGFQVFAHCDTRYALAGALFLWHPPRVVTGNYPLTPKDAYILAKDLASISKRLTTELLRRMPIDRAKFWYHFNAETLHSTGEVRKLSPGWLSLVKDIPGTVSLLPGNSGGSSGAYLPPEPGRITYIWSEWSE